MALVTKPSDLSSIPGELERTYSYKLSSDLCHGKQPSHTHKINKRNFKKAF